MGGSAGPDLTEFVETVNKLNRTIIIKNRQEEIAQVVRWSRQIGNSLDLPEKQVFALEVSIEELVTNIVWYAFQEGDDNSIQIDYLVDEKRLYFILKDKGIPFNPMDRPPPVVMDNLEDMKIGGLGLVLVKKMMDGMSYERIDGENIQKIWLDLTPELLKEELMQRALTINSEKEDGVLVFKLTGWLNAQSYQKAEQGLIHWIDSGEKMIAGDLSNLDFISSIGLRVLMTTSNNLEKSGGKLVLFGVQDQVQDVFNSTGVSTIISIATTREKALAILKSEIY